MKTVVLLGAGKIGRMVAEMLGKQGRPDYKLRIGDASSDSAKRLAELIGDTVEDARKIDFTNAAALDQLMAGADAVISCAPYYCNPLIAERAAHGKLHYFDLTEDVRVTDQVVKIARDADTAFIPQCGLAPGFITIVAVHLLKPLVDVSKLRLRVGALPRFPGNMLKYNLSWSTEGLINEYCQPCEVVIDHELRSVQPLENLEELTIDGVRYEAFNTSGGLGTLADSLKGKVRNVNYKSLRYPGHNYLLKFLLDDLRMRDRQDVLAEIFEECLPITFKDQIVIYASAIGTYRGRLTEDVYARTIYHQKIDGQNWSGIQITTAAGVCGVIDLLFKGKLPNKGLVRMEDVEYDDFITNRFGKHYA